VSSTHMPDVKIGARLYITAETSTMPAGSMHHMHRRNFIHPLQLSLHAGTSITLFVADSTQSPE
jgi:hypothetical protein